MPVPDILVSREVTHQCLWNGLHQFKKEQIKNFQWETKLPPSSGQNSERYHVTALLSSKAGE